ncbi:hypothetical protein [Pontibacillus sp. HMF3514]|uniref:hypothetical protein n=1 Tax=Pontibacillus sp. HMF3514 TaxID=2692425 RepID=UPI00131FABAA|nr:hypothetical protein [Pontibacillus sp. HMF3514]QHE51556.1 hypothetical protein GS400_05685 [Pontibacillus sp. HMF3514]
MAFNQDFLMGFVSGTVVGAVGYRLYEQNGAQLSSLVQSSPLNMGMGTSPYSQQETGTQHSYEPSIEELVAQKEKLDDLIAEKKLAN